MQFLARGYRNIPAAGKAVQKAAKKIPLPLYRQRVEDSQKLQIPAYEFAGCSFFFAFMKKLIAKTPMESTMRRPQMP